MACKFSLADSTREDAKVFGVNEPDRVSELHDSHCPARSVFGRELADVMQSGLENVHTPIRAGRNSINLFDVLHNLVHAHRVSEREAREIGYAVERSHRSLKHSSRVDALRLCDRDRKIERGRTTRLKVKRFERTFIRNPRKCRSIRHPGDRVLERHLSTLLRGLDRNVSWGWRVSDH